MVKTVPEHETPNFRRNAKSKINTRANVHYQPSPGKFQMPTNDVKKYARDAKPKVDTSDPTPWARHPRSLEELTESEGFLINPRFKKIVESSNFQSPEELLTKLCWTDEELRSFRHSKAKGISTSSEKPDTGGMKRGDTEDVTSMESWAVEDMEEERGDEQSKTEEGKATTRHEADSFSAQLSSTEAVV